jgi:hypothetical protein
MKESKIQQAHPKTAYDGGLGTAMSPSNALFLSFQAGQMAFGLAILYVLLRKM